MNPDPRQLLFSSIKSFYSTVRDGAYEVKRGTFNWSTHPFSKKQRAVSISMASGMLLPQHQALGLRKCIVHLEVLGKVTFSSEACCDDTDGQISGDTNLDDAFLTELLNDVESMLYHLMSQAQELVPIGYEFPVIFKVNQTTASFNEILDTVLGCQGIMANFEVDY